MSDFSNTLRYRMGTTSLGRPIMMGANGLPETEKSITVSDPRRPGGFMNIPSIYNGNRVREQDAFSTIINNDYVDPDTGREITGYGSMEEAIEAAKERSASLSNDPGMLEIKGRLEFLRQGTQSPDVFRSQIGPDYSPKHNDVTLKQSIIDGFYLDNEVAAIMKIANKPDFPNEPGYDVFADPALKEKPNYIQYTIHSESRAETAHIIADVDQEMERRRRSGGEFLGRFIGGFGPTDVAALFAPIPFLSGAKNGNRLKRVLAAGAGTTLVAAPKDILLEATQYERPLVETAMGLGAAFVLGGTLGAFTKRSPIEARATPFNPEDIADAAKARGSVGAMGVRAETSIQQEMYDDALQATGIKLERGDWNPMLRMLKSRFPHARWMVSDMVPLGGMKQNKIKKGEATSVSVETEFAVNYQHTLANSMRHLDEQWRAYRQGRAAEEVTDTSDFTRSLDIGKLQAGDFIDNIRYGFNRVDQPAQATHMSHGQFREAVGKAMRRNDSSAELPIPEAAKPYVDAAARRYRAEIFERLSKDAQEVGLFERALKNRQAALLKEKRILGERIRNQNRTTGSQATDLNDELIQLQGKIDALDVQMANLNAFGPTINTAPSYLTRMWRHDEIVNRYDELHGIIAGWLRTRGHTPQEVSDLATEIIEQDLLRQKPYTRINENDQFDDFVGDVGMVQQRSLDIPDKLVEDFLESDIEAISRFYTNSVGMDVLLARKFGDPSLKDPIQIVIDEAAELTAAATTRAERKAINDDLKRTLTDIRGLRDKLRGTYGLPNDPFRPLSRALRIGKVWNVLTMGGGFAISAIPDLARTVMTEGLKESVGYGLKHMFSGQGRAVRSMMKEELQLSGTALDMVLGTRALQFADIGDVYGKKFKFERGLMRAQGAYFIVNGLHMWNTGLKTFAGTVAGLRIADDCIKWAREITEAETAAIGGHPFVTLSQARKEKLLRHGIDANMAKRIAAQIQENGEKINGSWVPNTELWQLGTRADVQAMRNYRAALNQDADRTIITPNVGDRALWTSTEFGSVIAQFKSFGQSALPKLMISGIQENDAAFWSGLTLLVAMGHLTNEIKRAQYGDTRERSFDENLVEAIDRSGSLAVFMDINNAAEKLSNYQLGIKPLLDMSPPYDASIKSVAGVLGGPTGSQVANAVQIGSDILSLDVDHWTKKRMRQFVPGQNLPYLDPVMDKVF